MIRTCDKCRNLVFNHVEEGTFRADLYEDSQSLREAASSRACDFCVTLQGMVEHYALWPAELRRQYGQLYPGEQAISIFLFFNQKTEDMDDWDYVEEETDWKSIQESMTVNHPEGRIDFRVRSLDILDLSDVEDDETSERADRLDKVTIESPKPDDEDDSTGSDASMSLAASWIGTCRATHDSCRRSANVGGLLPRRLLDVSGAVGSAGRVRLVTFDDVSAQKVLSYVTLSHRWEPTSACLVMTSNIQTISEKGMLISDLSPTFAHACVTTCKLGFEFLWIDSLCIIQDSDSDKAQEIPKMADYYQNAELNIAASSQGRTGLWRSRAVEATRPFKLDITLIDPQGSRKATLQIAPILRGQKSHLDHRAWVLQERVFSTRTLFFDPYWIAFECTHMSASESCPDGIPNSSASPVRLPILLGTEISRDCSLSLIGGVIRNSARLQPAAKSIAEQSTEKEMLKLWYRIVEEYSLRQMTFESDQLDAISGLVARLAHILNDEYIGGLWRRDLIRGLQWHASRWRNKPVAFRQAEYRAPTWSWASTVVRRSDDAIQSEIVSPSGLSNDAEDSRALVTVIDVEWTCQTSNPYSSLSMARLTLVGRPIRSFVYYSEQGPDINRDLLTIEEPLEGLPHSVVDRSKEQETPPSQRAWYGSQKHYIHMCGETVSGERTKLILFLDPDTCNQENEGWAHVLPLADRNLFGSGADVEQSDLFCLVLREAVGNVFQRIGVARSQARYMITVPQRQLVLV